MQTFEHYSHFSHSYVTYYWCLQNIELYKYRVSTNWCHRSNCWYLAYIFEPEMYETCLQITRNSSRRASAILPIVNTLKFNNHVQLFKVFYFIKTKLEGSVTTIAGSWNIFEQITRTVFRFITSTDSLQFIHLKSAK